MADDSELLLLYATQRSEDAFSELVHRHLGSVYSIALRRVGGDVHLAQEVAQEVFTDLARKAESLSRREVLMGWLFVSTRFAAGKALRRDRQRQFLNEKAQFMFETFASEKGEPDWDHVRPVLEDLIGRLNQRDREAVLLRFFENRTFADIGAKLLLTENAARMRVDRALEKLRASLGRRGIVSTSAALTVALSTQVAASVPTSLAATITAAALSNAAQSGAIFLTFMSLSKTQLSAAIAIVLAGATFLGFAQHREIASLREEENALVKDATQNRNQVTELNAKLKEAATTREKMEAQLADLRTAVKSAGAKTATENGATVLHLKDIIRDHPEYAVFERKHTRNLVLQQYGKAISAMTLSSDEKSKLKDLLIDRETAIGDAVEAAKQLGIQGGSEDMGRAMTQAANSVDKDIDALIGEKAFEELKSRQETVLHGNSQADDYAIDMSEAGAPLSGEQTRKLDDLLSSFLHPIKDAWMTPPKFLKADRTTWLSPSDLQLLDQAGPILSSDQLSSLKKSLGEENHEAFIINQYASKSDGPIVITR